MTILEFLLLILIAAVCGALAQALAGYSLGGCLVSAALGFVGALLGSWIARSLGLPPMYTMNVGGQPFPVIWSILGSTLFVLVISLFHRHSRTRVV